MLPTHSNPTVPNPIEDERQAYEKPVLTKIGSLANLTQGNPPGAITDGEFSA